jgi:two-component system cell cycle response regulator
MGIEIFFAGKRHFINSDRIQILDLLFSTYESAVQQKRDLELINKELKDALDTIKTLHGLLPICSHCKKIRDENGEWQYLEVYISRHSEAKFTHGICPECKKKLYSELL